MNQGATQHLRAAHGDGLSGRAAETSALEHIANETGLIRRAIGPSLLTNTLERIVLPSGRYLPDAYRAGNIAALSYSLNALLDNEQLGGDLERFAALYARCVQVKESLTANGRISTSARSEKRRKSEVQPIPEFKPRDSNDYLVKVPASTQRRTRLHEALVRAFGEAVSATNRTPLRTFTLETW